MSAPVVKAGVIALSVAVAAAIAVYESPELRRLADDLRRRIAIALHSLGDGINPATSENLFNRPEDAEGFLQSRGMAAGGEAGVDADDETRRRQREELMYWNAVLESKKEHELRTDSEKSEVAATESRPGRRPRTSTRGSSFDDFLRQDDGAEKGAFVFNSGTDTREDNDGLIRRRGNGVRGLNQSILTNPFADEHGIDENIAFENSLMEPEQDEVMSDLYSATDLGKDDLSRTQTLSPAARPVEPVLIDLSSSAELPAQSSTPQPALADDEYVTAGQDDRHDAYSSIQAWAQTSNPSFYSPLPVSPAGPLSEPELVSDGALTPTDSASLAGSGVDVAHEVASVRSHEDDHYHEVMSDDDGMATPASWTEVGSVISESDAGAIHV